MNPILPHDGNPGEHAGISHALKHYLDPREMWEDIAGEVEPHLRPLAFCERLPPLTPPVWEQWQAPTRELAPLWNSLRPLYRLGYARIVRALAEPLAEPFTPGSPWARGDDSHGAHIGQGVVLWVRRAPNGWRMTTAYRPVDFKLREHACPPRDATSVSLRGAIARFQADRHLARWRQESQE